MAQSKVVLGLDAGALIAAGKGRRIDALIQKWLDEGAEIIVPAPAIAEAIRGRPSDAAANRLIKAAREVAITTEAIARSAGARLAAARSSATIDALVVASAEAHFATDILTSDPDDIRALCSPNVNVIAL